MQNSILFMMLLLVACRQDAGHGGSVMPENIQGTWKVVSSKRNNRNALSLANSEFYITQDSFSTNFLPDREQYPYAFDGEIISVMDSVKSQFRVTRKTPDTLIFKTIIKNFEFSFEAVAKKDTLDD